jgi:tyrosine-protein kinase Etk/Wzc
MNRQPLRFIDHIMLWIRWRWFLIGAVFCSAVLTAGISIILPKTYRASAIVMPPFDSGSGLSFLSGINVDIFGTNEIASSGLITLLKSRTFQDSVNARIDLVKHYQVKDVEQAYKALENHLFVDLETEETFGAVSVISFQVNVNDRDPQYAADLLHVIVEEWDKLTVELNQRTASLRRQFVETNLRQNSSELAAGQDSLRAFQERHGLASIEAQVTGTVSTAMALGRKIADARVAVQVMEKVFQPDYPELQRGRLKLQQLLAEEQKMKEAGDGSGLMLPLSTAPEISLEFARLYRQAKMLETMNDILVQQYEQARFQEMKNIPALRIVDRGSVPLHKYRPKRLILVIIASLSGFFLAVVVMYFRQYLANIRGTEDYRWVEEIAAELRHDRNWITGRWRRGGKSSP